MPKRRNDTSSKDRPTHSLSSTRRTPRSLNDDISSSRINEQSAHSSSDILTTESNTPSSSSIVAVMPRPRPPNRRIRQTEDTESGTSRQSRISWRWSTWSGSFRQRQRKSNGALSILFLHKRRTYPPCSRVLKRETKRFTHPKQSIKDNTRKIRRHSLAGMLSTFVSGGSSSRHQQRQQQYPSVRSSMVLHVSDNDVVGMHVPEVLYNDDDDFMNPSISSISSRNQPSVSNCQHCNDGQCPKHQRRRHTESIPPLPPKSSFSASTSSLQRRQRRGHWYSEGNWFYSWIQHHTRSNKNKQRLLQKQIMVSSDSSESSGLRKKKKDKRQQPEEQISSILRPPTISSISSMSVRCLSKHESYIRHHPPRRFSAFWFDTQGRSGKHLIHVDEKGDVAIVSPPKHPRHPLFSVHQHHPCLVHASIFLFGFLCFPLWWIGAWIYLRHHHQLHGRRDPEALTVALATPRMLGQLNCWMTVLSVMLTPVLIGLGIWYKRSLPY